MELTDEVKKLITDDLEKNEQLLENSFDILTQDTIEKLWKSGLKHNKIKEKILHCSNDKELIREVFNSKPKIECLKLRHNDNIPEDILEQIYNKTNDSYILSHINFPIKKLENRIDTLDSYSLERIAENKNCPPEILTKLFQPKNKNIFDKIAKNKNTPKEILKRIYYEIPYYRYYIIQNPNCPEDILEETCKTKSIKIKSIIAANPKTPKEFLIKLSKSKSYRILKSIVNNPSCPKIVLLKLATSPEVDKTINEMAKVALRRI